MKNSRSILIFFLVLSSYFLFSQEVIWGGPGDPNGEFDGGLNDWTAISVSPNDQALWYWNDDGDTDGAYEAVNAPLNSASIANGCASFDSDFLDNNGIQGNFGLGASAAPQRGELVSPEFSTLGIPEVTIIWTQYVRQFQSSFSIEVTSDGGLNWTSYPINFNNDMLTNTVSENGMEIGVDVSEAMGDKETVQFKFVYEANYYFWSIDDVAVVKTPLTDFIATDMYYPFNAASIPLSCLNADSLEFSVDIMNNGSADFSNINAALQIIDFSGTVIYEFNQKSGLIPKGDTVTVVFDDFVSPQSINLDIGSHIILYTISSTLWEDKFPINNSIGSAVLITENEYAINRGLNDSHSFNSGNYSAAMVVRTGFIPNNFNYIAKKVTVAGVDQFQDSIKNAKGNISILKILNQQGESLDPLFASSAYGVDNDHENLELVAYGSFSTLNAENFQDITCTIYDSNTNNMGVVLDKNSSYLIALEWDSSENSGYISTGSSNSINYHQDVAMVYIHDDPLNKGWYKTDKEIAWYMPLEIEVQNINSTSFSKIEEQKVNVYPNPTSETTIVELQFDKPTNVVLILRDASGAFLSSKSIEDVMSNEVTYNVTDLPAGTYFIEITTEENAQLVKSFIKID